MQNTQANCDSPTHSNICAQSLQLYLLKYYYVTKMHRRKCAVAYGLRVPTCTPATPSGDHIMALRIMVPLANGFQCMAMGNLQPRDVTICVWSKGKEGGGLKR